jgi:ribosomal protein S18 acetylase RimI-like enzyme
MQIKIQLAKKGQARDCLSCVKQSELWEAYFKSNATAVDDIEKMISKKQIYVALNQNKCIGFMGIIHKGCFRNFSYLSIIAVKNSYRSKGVGKELLKKFEETGFKQANRVFLLVSDFNKKAQLLYRKLGYNNVGKIPDLFKKGVSEHVMVKYESTI